MAQEADLERDAGLNNANKNINNLPPKLIKFRDLTGISTPFSLTNTSSPRAAQNLGIYTRIISEERKTHYQYYFMSTLVNASTLLQTVVAAALTALGASSSSHIAITILGAVNTVIAGLQTYLKGQGLPNRLRQYQFGLRKLREYIEDRERDFSVEECALDVDYVINDVGEMYKAVRQTAEDNTPDTYLPMGGAGKKLLGSKANGLADADEDRDGGEGGSTDAEPTKTDTVGGEELREGNGGGNANPEATKADTSGEVESGGNGEEVRPMGGASNETNPNHLDETEDAPLLNERRT